jgi:hypothetical protein
VIRIVGDARFAKVAVHRGHFDPSVPWQHGIDRAGNRWALTAGYLMFQRCSISLSR